MLYPMEIQCEYFIRITSDKPITLQMIRNINMNLSEEEFKILQPLFTNMHVIVNDTIKKPYGLIASTLRSMIDSKGKIKYIAYDPLKDITIQSLTFMTTVKNRKPSIYKFFKLIKGGVPDLKLSGMWQRVKKEEKIEENTI